MAVLTINGGRVRRGVQWRCGFTLVEVVITVLIIGIITSIAVPRYATALISFRAAAAARRVVADLEYARRLAKVSGKPQSVAFDTMTDSYSLTGRDDLDRVGRAYSVDLADDTYKSQIITASFGGSSTVAFDRYGKPDNGGTVVVQSGQKQRTVLLDAASGKATLQP